MVTKYQRLMGFFDRLISYAYQSGDPEQAKGFISEKKVARALDRMRSQGKISDYLYLGMTNEFDRRGKDFIVIKRGNWFFLQVKSSGMGKLRHLQKERKLRRKYSNTRTVPVVVVDWNDSDYDLQKKIESSLALS